MKDKKEILKICQKCNASCCKLNGGDTTEKERNRILKEGFKDYFIKIAPNHYEIKYKSTICPYLKKDNSCRIHSIRPLRCKCWPVFAKVIDGKRKFFLAECPLTKELSKKDITECKKIASKLDKNYWEDSWTNTKLPKSKQKIIKKRLARFKEKEIK